MVEESPIVTLDQITEKVGNRFKAADRKTVRRLLLENDIGDENRFKRMEWARRHENWRFNQWEKIIFSNESDLSPFRTKNIVVRRGLLLSPI
jgi:hypothetical protein